VKVTKPRDYLELTSHDLDGHLEFLAWSASRFIK
jgi:hypothetical protein